jgi:competence protein ComFB
MIRNYMEEAYDHVAPQVLKDYDDICKCEKCLEDIKAMTLNRMKPMYSVTEKGSMFLKLGEELELQFKTDLMLQIIQSIKIVSEHPKHSV